MLILSSALLRPHRYDAGSAHLTVSAMVQEVKAGGKVSVHCLVQQFCATAPTWNSLVHAGILCKETVSVFEEKDSGSTIIMLQATRSGVSLDSQADCMSCFDVANLVGGKGDQRKAIEVGLKTALDKDNA